MSEQLATLSVAVVLENGVVKQATHSTNLPDMAVWRQVVDSLWVDQVRRQAEQEAQKRNEHVAGQ